MNSRKSVAVLSAMTVSLSGLMGMPTALAVPLATSSLNLTSTKHTIQAGTLSNFHNENISVGQGTMHVGSNTMLTPAEAIALQQVIESGQQSLLIGATGNAIGGSFNFAGNNRGMTNLVVPKQVTALDTFSVGNTSVFSGNIVNGGALYAVSTNAGLRSVALVANDITNLASGVISGKFASGTTGVTATDGLDLTLTANVSLINSGAIKSTGMLTLNSSGSIFNAGTGRISSENDLNLSADQGLYNLGFIGSAKGNVNVSAPSIPQVQVTSSGTIEALDGSISFLGQGTSKWMITGGNYLSRQLNFDFVGGSGKATLANVTGVINVTADNMSIQTSLPNLAIGTWNVTSPATIINTGNISLQSITTNGESILVVSGRNITGSAGMQLSTASQAGPAGNVTLLAGAKFKLDRQGNLLILGSDAAGGTVDCSLSQSMSIDTSSAKAEGGAVNIDAFAGLHHQAGRVFLPSEYSVDTCSGDGAQSGTIFIDASCLTTDGASTAVSDRAIDQDQLLIDSAGDASDG